MSGNRWGSKCVTRAQNDFFFPFLLLSDPSRLLIELQSRFSPQARLPITR